MAEEPVDTQVIGHWTIQRMPDNEACYQASVGAGLKLNEECYMGFRGDPVEVEDMLRRAWKAMKSYNARKSIKVL